MEVFVALALIFLLSLVLYRASEWLIGAIKVLVKDGVGSAFFLGSIFVGVATSIPEIFVGVISAVEKIPIVSFGNAIGSNIVNIALVFPAAILCAPYVLHIRKDNFSGKTTFLLMTSALFPFLLALDGKLSVFDGLFLISLFFIYSLYLFNKRVVEHRSSFNLLHRLETLIYKSTSRRALVVLAASLIVLLLGSHLLLQNALFLAERLNVNPYLVALFIIAPATSLPELFVALAAVRKHEIDVLYGDIFGSLVTNANLVVGLTSVIRPFSISLFPEHTLSLVGLVGSFTLFVAFSFTKKNFVKWEAMVLIAFYLLFLIAESIV